MQVELSKEINNLTIGLKEAKLSISNHGGTAIDINLDDRQRNDIADFLGRLPPSARSANDARIISGAKLVLQGSRIVLSKLEDRVSLDLSGQAEHFGGVSKLREQIQTLEKSASGDNTLAFQEFSILRGRDATVAAIGDYFRARSTYADLLPRVLDKFEQSRRTEFARAPSELAAPLVRAVARDMSYLRDTVTPEMLEFAVKALAFGVTSRLDFELARVGRDNLRVYRIGHEAQLSCEPKFTYSALSANARRRFILGEDSDSVSGSPDLKLRLDPTALGVMWIERAMTIRTIAAGIIKLGWVKQQDTGSGEAAWSSALRMVCNPDDKGGAPERPVFEFRGGLCSIMDIVDSATGRGDPQMFAELGGLVTESPEEIFIELAEHQLNSPPNSSGSLKNPTVMDLVKQRLDLAFEAAKRDLDPKYSENPAQWMLMAKDIQSPSPEVLYDRALVEHTRAHPKTRAAILSALLRECGGNASVALARALARTCYRLEHTERTMQGLITMNAPQSVLKIQRHQLGYLQYFKEVLTEG